MENDEKYRKLESVLFILLCEKAYEEYSRILKDPNFGEFEKFTNIKEGDLVMEISSFFQKNRHSLRIGFAAHDYNKNDGSELDLFLLDGRPFSWTNASFINIGFMIDKGLLSRVHELVNQDTPN